MHKYVLTLILAALLYPLCALLFWGAYETFEVLGDAAGVGMMIGTGVAAGIVLWIMRSLSHNVPYVLRGIVIRFLGAEIVGGIAVLQILLTIRVESGEWLWVGPGGYMTLHMPAFVATFVAFHLVGYFVEKIIPETEIKKGYIKK